CCAGAPATPVIESQEIREMRDVGFDLCQELRITGPSPNARTRQQHPGEAAAPGPHPDVGPARRCGPVVGSPVKKLSIKFDGFLAGIQVGNFIEYCPPDSQGIGNAGRAVRKTERAIAVRSYPASISAKTTHEVFHAESRLSFRALAW